MKKRLIKLLPAVMVFIIAAAVAVIGIIYYNFISLRIYEDSTDHLQEIYGQVNRSFGAFVERNWGLLGEWGDFFAAQNDPSTRDAEISSYIAEKRDYWGFSEFCFLSEDSCMTSNGTIIPGGLEKTRTELLSENKPVMSGESGDGQDQTVFAAPVERGEYRGFGYFAVAISYNNADMASSLKVDAFSGKAKCFVVHSSGEVLLSTQAGGNVFENYLTYLGGASDLDDRELADISQDWATGAQGLKQCEIGGESQCILYQPIGYRDYILLSVVPQSAVSAGFLSVQKITVYVLVTIFLLISAAAITAVILRARKQSHKNRTELIYREKMFDVLSISVDDIFVMIDAESHTVDYISPNTERLLGIPIQDARKDIRALGRCAVSRDFVVPKDELEKIPLNGNSSWECEYVHQSTGERRWYKMTIYHMTLQGVRKYISVMSDRTREQQMNQKLQEALNAAQSANEAKSNFLSNMSHDIRTPMNAIVGFSVLLEKDADRPEKVREYTKKIAASSQHLLSLINDVLDMSKIESGKTSLNVDCFSLPRLLEEIGIIIMPQAKAKKQDFRINLQGNPPERLIGDKLRLNQILINLLSNAVKYTQDGGKIDFNIAELPNQSRQYSTLRFTVKDNGIGMSEEFQKKVFAPFSREINSVTNKIQGTGLGMAITKNLVDLMGGIIGVESKTGEGSVFTVELTFAVPEDEGQEAWFGGKVSKMLIADDEEDICRSVEELMEDVGVEVSFVTDGDAAVEEAVRAHDSGSGYNVILLDWKMPGTDGVAAAKKIRERIGADVPILVLTSYDWSDIEDEAREAGISAFMPKPFFVSTFREALKPLFEPYSEEKEPEAEPEESPMKGLHFLVAEDNELNAEIITEMIEMEGATCETAVNGLEAAEMFEKSEKGRFDLILMDVQMPVMNGYDATKRIRASSHPDAAKIPIAAMTANTFAEDVRDALASGMNGHLAKPIDMKAMRELIGRLMRPEISDKETENEA